MLQLHDNKPICKVVENDDFFFFFHSEVMLSFGEAEPES